MKYHLCFLSLFLFAGLGVDPVSLWPSSVALGEEDRSAEVSKEEKAENASQAGNGTGKGTASDDPQVDDDADKQPRPENEAKDPGIPVWELSPAAEPSPALTYRFWPEPTQTESGDAFDRFMRAALLLSKMELEAFQEHDDLMEAPMSEFPIERAREALRPFNTVIRETRQGAMLSVTPRDLGTQQLKGAELYAFVLPEIEEMRRLARLLKLQSKVELAEGNLEKAFETIQASFRLGFATGRSTDFLISRLAGVAIINMSLGQAEAVIKIEDSPNLYWALATLPSDIGDVSGAMRYEMSVIERVLPELFNLPDPDSQLAESLPASVWQERLVRTIAEFQTLYGVADSGRSHSDREDTSARLTAAMALIALSDPSRKQLSEYGYDEQTVEEMSAAEAILRASAEQIERVVDQQLKWCFLPEPMRQRYLQQSGEQLNQSLKKEAGFGSLASQLAAMIVPSLSGVQRASDDLSQSVAKLITVEAIRHHVARQGSLPESLDEMTELPAWQDPSAEGPFGYQKLTPNTARLSWQSQLPEARRGNIVLSFPSLTN